MFDFLWNKKTEEKVLIKKALSHLLALGDENDSKPKNELALLLIYLGAIDGARHRYHLRYEAFLNLADEFFQKIEVDPISVEILLDYHMDHAGNLVAWEAVQEGLERYYQWSINASGWKLRGHQSFWGNYILNENFPRTVGDLMLAVAEIERLSEKNPTAEEVVFEEIIEDL